MMLGIVSGGATTHESPTNVECSLKYRISCVVLRTSNVRQLHSGAPLLSYNLRILYTRFGTSILFSFTFRSRHSFFLSGYPCTVSRPIRKNKAWTFSGCLRQEGMIVQGKFLALDTWSMESSNHGGVEFSS